MTDRSDDLSLFNRQFKVILIGNQGSGKSSICSKYDRPEASIEAVEPTIGTEFRHKVFKDRNNLRLNIWDTAGDEKFFSIVRAFLRGANAVIIAVDLTSTIEDITKQIRLWKSTAESQLPRDVLFILAGTKSDLRDESSISDKEFTDISNENNFYMHYITSAKETMNISEMFEDIANNLELFYKSEYGPSDDVLRFINDTYDGEKTKRYDVRSKRWDSSPSKAPFNKAIDLLREYALADSKGNIDRGIFALFKGHPNRSYRKEISKVISQDSLNVINGDINKLLGAIKHQLNGGKLNSEGALRAVIDVIKVKTGCEYDAVAEFDVESGNSEDNSLEY